MIAQTAGLYVASIARAIRIRAWLANAPSQAGPIRIRR